MQDTIVIYHANCLDGYGAAYAAWKKFGHSAEYIPAHYGNTPPDVTGKDVYILDFSYPRETLLKMHMRARNLLVIDHHKTAQADLIELPFAKFDMSKSGCVLAWEHFHPEDKAPFGLELIQDRDLWQFRMPQTKAYCEALRNLVDYSFTSWDYHLTTGYCPASELTERGEDLLAVFNADIDSLAKRAHAASLRRIDLIACNAPPKYASELGNVLAKAAGKPAAIYSFNGATESWDFSLRSVGDFDVSEIAKYFGGGGHKNAAGFSIKAISLSFFNPSGYSVDLSKECTLANGDKVKVSATGWT
jgi:oligoribonuclease NrnB/cAMP/cGMP phosphodiesterase (DHH superfamily)